MVAARMPDHGLLLTMLDTSYTRRGLLCEGLSNQNVDGGYSLCKSLPDDRAYRDTNLEFSSVVPWVSTFCCFIILNDVFDHPPKRCRAYSLYLRLTFF